jgi:predicted DNA-binding protein (MmcQ/YjbR family)
MDVEEIREYCLQKKDVEESFPFGNDMLVFKISSKIFLLLSLESAPVQFNVKCDPDLAIELRERYSAVLPGYHMNKKHWNTIVCDQTVPKKKIYEFIDHSYAIVGKKLPKKRS